jgi:hypothetical protein
MTFASISAATRWDVTWATWALVIVGILGTVCALLTLYILKKQTAAIEKQAKTMMDADRALLLIQWDNFIHINPEAANGVLSHCFRWYVHNSAKSPAFIERVHSRFVVLKQLDDLPPEPVFLPPKEIRQAEPLLPEQKYGPIYSPIESELSFPDLDAQLRGKKCFVYAYGFASYRDIYQRLHETRFGLIYEAAPSPNRQLDRFRLSGPPAYNRYG